jgi:collagen type III alpha
MSITILGTTPGAVPDRVDIPGTPPKIVPGAADAQDPAWPSSDSDAAAGMKGINGSPGEIGANNVNGGDTPSQLNFIVEGFVGVFTVTVLGGNGGVGGRGGTGGNGGEGQDGGHGDDDSAPGAGGPGGDGGPGGAGGNGGNGGNANSFDLYIPNAQDAITLNTTITFSGGFLGQGGEGGNGGTGGPGGFPGGDNTQPRAQQGNPGGIGQPGQDGNHNGATGVCNLYVGVNP